MKSSDKLSKLYNEYGFKKVKPISQDLIEAVSSSLGLGREFLDLYLFSNGMSHEWFRVLPIEDKSNIKNTWDSIQKANDSSGSKFELDDEFLERFVVFAEIGAGECAIIDKEDGSIWFEENDEFQRTDLELYEFIELCLKEVEEL